jgi:phosphoenolpyruvate-protein phosphotransferase (PTS system enzyme I)
VSAGHNRELHGIAASPGVAVGVALVLDRRRMSIPRRHIEEAEVEREVQRLRDAVVAARRQLQEVREKVSSEAGEHTLILDAHLLMLDDALLLDQAEGAIRNDLVNAEWGLRRTVENIKVLFDKSGVDYFRERRSDVDFVGERVLREMMGASSPIAALRDVTGPVVLVAHELSPADTASLVNNDVLAFVTDVGTATSHTAIMARALSIPAVVGVADATKEIATGDLVVVNGLRGVVTVTPDDLAAQQATDRGDRYQAFVRSLRGNHLARARTRCGAPVALRANIELPAEAAVAIDHGADGIGLYRTEFLYIDRHQPPTEEEQYEVFRRIVEMMSPRRVTLRTFDLGGDKFSTAFRIPKELNPALGIRAVRLALREAEVFRAQLRAMLRAAAWGEVRVMVPMVSTLTELRAARAELDRAREELRARGDVYGDVAFGIMVETPSAVTLADHLAREADFFSIGTNDLMQYAFAIDRGNEHVAHLARSLDPAIIRSIAHVAAEARTAGIGCAICGAMAGELMAVPLLLGVGVHELSVEPTAVPEIKEAISRVDLAAAQEMAREALTLGTATEVEALVRARFGQTFADLLAAGEGAELTETGSIRLPEYRGD